MFPVVALYVLLCCKVPAGDVELESTGAGADGERGSFSGAVVSFGVCDGVF